MKKLLILFIIYCGLVCNCFAQQAPVIEWQNTIGGSDSEWLSSIEKTSDGGFIIGGSSLSWINGDKTVQTFGWFDYWVLKLDSIGNILWQKNFGGDGFDYLKDIEVTQDDGFIIAGFSSSGITGNKTEMNLGGFDYWALKLNSYGDIIWQNTIGGNNDEQLFSIKQTIDGGYILGGLSNSNISSDKTENSHGLNDFWIVKLDSSGNVMWENTIGGSDQDLLNSISKTNDGCFILGGFSYSPVSGDKTESSILSDFWIIKTDSVGNIIWQNTIGGSLTDCLKSIEQTNDAGYILGGYSSSDISNDKN